MVGGALRSGAWVLRSVFVFVVLAAATSCGSPKLDDTAIADVNRGVALMGRFDYDSAVEQFTDLSKRYPRNPDLLINLAIAILNRQSEGDEDRAAALIDQAVELAPESLRGHYCRGLLHLNGGRAVEALASFETVLARDPEDADATYFAGQCLMQLSRYEEALTAYQRTIDLDAYLRSAYYRAFQALQRVGRQEEAMALLETFESLDDNPRSRLVEFKYTKMGALGAVVALDAASPMSAATRPDGSIFADPVAGPELDGPIGRADAAASSPSLSVADLDRDGRLEVVLANGRVTTVLGIGENGMILENVPNHPLANREGVRTVLLGDIDNDGLTDAYLGRKGPNELWRQTADGGWENVTAAAGTTNGNHDTVDGAMVDADHDGDLDIFCVNADGPNGLLNNNRDGSFREIAEDHGFAGGNRASRRVLFADLDTDRDTDIIVIHDEPPHDVLHNDLLWRYRAPEGWNEFRSADIVAAVAGDADADGRIEVFTSDSAAKTTRWVDHEGRRQPHVFEIPPPADEVLYLALADLTGDGRLELCVVTRSGWTVIDPTGPGRVIEAGSGDFAAARLALVRPASGPSLVTLSTAGPSILPPGPGRLPQLAFDLTGGEDAGASMRSNASGIGSRIVTRVGSRWSALSTFRMDSGPGQSLQPVSIGLGGAERLDFVAVDWSDGVFQTEIGLEVGLLHHIPETQRQLSSCPVLFVWDGEKWAFVSDLLGVGGMGYAVGPGEYTEPRPRETILLPAGTPVPRDGKVAIKLTEPMEEATYLDAARLVQYDLPPGWSMTLDERMGLAAPEPTGAPIFYRHLVLPAGARNERGADVTQTVLTVDGRAAPVGPLDRRFIGRLAGEHVLELSFGESLDHHPGSPVLVADGWVEYPYSQTNFAAWQAGATYDAPTLEARGADGRWRPLLVRFGYPAGMPRQMAVMLPELPPGTDTLRLRTNQEIYWDRVAVAYAEPGAGARRTELPLTRATLDRTGFPIREDLPQRYPRYDYAGRVPVWDVHLQAGFYTRLGAVEDLVSRRDDTLVVFGGGEEVHLEYEAGSQPLENGWTRVHILEVDGWCKDMDLFTRDGETVEPIPALDADTRRRDAIHRTTLTRYLGGRE